MFVQEKGGKHGFEVGDCMCKLIVAGVWLWCAGALAAGTPIQVTGTRVNLRARPDNQVEVVGQVDYNQALVAKSVQDDWVEIYPPPGSFVWIHRDYIVDGRVSAKRLNVRCGSGINYSIVGRLDRNTPVVPREEFGEWIKIDAPAVCSFWIHRDFVKATSPDATLFDDVQAPAPTVVAETNSPPDAEGRAPELEPPPRPESDKVRLRGLKLVPLEGQGKQVELEGVLRHTDFLIGRPSNFRLVKVYRNGQETICYLRGDADEMKKMFSKAVRIEGREYWAHKVGYPVVVPESITLMDKPIPVVD